MAGCRTGLFVVVASDGLIEGRSGEELASSGALFGGWRIEDVEGKQSEE